MSQKDTFDFFESAKPDQVYLAAAKVGGIYANQTYPAEFIYQNLIVQANVIYAAYKSNVNKLMFLGSSCIYPKFSSQPISESELMQGSLEPTNEPYAIAKIAGIKLCESFNRQYGVDYRSVMPTNLYGPGDNYHLKDSHVIPALIRRFHEAKLKNIPVVNVWGDGKPRREFLHVDDMADACVFLMNIEKLSYQSNVNPMESHINVGSGIDITISELAELVKSVIGYEGKVSFQKDNLNGPDRKLLNTSKINHMGWSPRINLKTGLISTYEDFQSTYETLRI
jgi:GDP-L-fucose synthase